MGFKCPYCLKDFGINKAEWREHLKNEHDGIGNDCVSAITNVYTNQDQRS